MCQNVLLRTPDIIRQMIVAFKIRCKYLQEHLVKNPNCRKDCVMKKCISIVELTKLEANLINLNKNTLDKNKFD